MGSGYLVQPDLRVPRKKNEAGDDVAIAELGYLPRYLNFSLSNMLAPEELGPNSRRQKDPAQTRCYQWRSSSPSTNKQDTY